MKKAFIEAIPFITLIGCLFIVTITVHLWPGKTSPLPKLRISTVNGTDFIPQNSGYAILQTGYIKAAGSQERYEDLSSDEVPSGTKLSLPGGSEYRRN